MSTEVLVKKWEMKDTLPKKDLIRFQIVVYCHFKNIHLSSVRLECLTLLGYTGVTELYSFCEKILEMGISTNMQSSRNALAWLETAGLIKKTRVNKKKHIAIHPNLQITNIGNVKLLIDILSPSKEPVVEPA